MSIARIFPYSAIVPLWWFRILQCLISSGTNSTTPRREQQSRSWFCSPAGLRPVSAPWLAPRPSSLSGMMLVMQGSSGDGEGQFLVQEQHAGIPESVQPWRIPRVLQRFRGILVWHSYISWFLFLYFCFTEGNDKKAQPRQLQKMVRRLHDRRCQCTRSASRISFRHTQETNAGAALTHPERIDPENVKLPGVDQEYLEAVGPAERLLQGHITKHVQGSIGDSHLVDCKELPEQAHGRHLWFVIFIWLFLHTAGQLCSYSRNGPYFKYRIIISIWKQKIIRRARSKNPTNSRHITPMHNTLVDHYLTSITITVSMGNPRVTYQCRWMCPSGMKAKTMQHITK